MDTDKYQRTIAMRCPTCAGTDFEFDPDPASEKVVCHECGRETTKEALKSDNRDVIAAQVEEVKAEVTRDAAKMLRESLQSAFRGSKNIRFK